MNKIPFAPWQEAKLEAYRPLSKIKIPTRTLRLRYLHSIIAMSGVYDCYKPDSLEMPLLRMFTIAGDATKIRECYKRYNLLDRKRRTEELVEEWPAVQQGFGVRHTLNMVWIHREAGVAWLNGQIALY
jgi:hypothetical protein